MYPKVLIHKDKLKNNVDKISDKLSYLEELYIVTKGYTSYLPLIELYRSWGLTNIADSRSKSLEKVKKAFPDLNTLQLRIVMPCEVERVVKYVDRSLNSELSTIKLLNEEARKQNKTHEIILMIDVGDLREGIMFDSDYLGMVKEIIKLDHINLVGIGTNVTCYGCVMPDENNMQLLVDIRNDIENKLNIEIPIISGGNSSVMNFAYYQKMPPEINNLRVGDSFIRGIEAATYQMLPGLEKDIFQLEAQIVEIKNKPSYPIGQRSYNAFGQEVEFNDVGIHTRAIIALGRYDLLADEIHPIDPRISILGTSSDHIILEIKDNDYQVGDIVTFNLDYGAIMNLFGFDNINKQIV